MKIKFFNKNVCTLGEAFVSQQIAFKTHEMIQMVDGRVPLVTQNYALIAMLVNRSSCSSSYVAAENGVWQRRATEVRMSIFNVALFAKKLQYKINPKPKE